MKRSQLKEMIKPIVRECVHETILNDGLLSNIISEVASGLGNQFIIENKETIVPQETNENSFRMEHLREGQQEAKKKLLDDIGRDTFNGVDLFEGTSPIRDSGTPSATSQANPLGGQEPGDPGVDISAIVALSGKNWKSLASN